MSKHTRKMFSCMCCQHGFTTEKLLNKHLINGCVTHETQQTVMPKEDEKMSCQKQYKKLKCPYGDFECLTTPLSEGIESTYVNENGPKPLKGAYQHHKS